MNNVWVWLLISLLALVFGFIHYSAGYEPEKKNKNRYYKILDIWRSSVNYFIPGVIIYYFISTRWPHIVKGDNFSFGDFTLGIILLMGVFGWLPYFIKNVTEAIQVIFERLLKSS